MRIICVWKQQQRKVWEESTIKKISSLFNRLRLIQSKNTHRRDSPGSRTVAAAAVGGCSQQHQPPHSLLPIFYEWIHIFFFLLSFNRDRIVLFSMLCFLGFGKFFHRKISAHHMKVRSHCKQEIWLRWDAVMKKKEKCQWNQILGILIWETKCSFCSAPSNVMENLLYKPVYTVHGTHCTFGGKNFWFDK